MKYIQNFIKFLIVSVTALFVLFVTGTVYAARVAAVPLSQTASVGSCNTASTTAFSIPNPFNSTSTATLNSLVGVVGATTTDFAVGTSSTPFVAGGSTNIGVVKENLLALSTLATGTQFYVSSIAGRTSFSQATGTTATGVATVNQNSVVVGPNESLIGYATGTWSGVGNGNGALGTPIVPSCTYKFTWIN